jgi:carbon-monoxide dehydrogenase small subunit
LTILRRHTPAEERTRPPWPNSPRMLQRRSSRTSIVRLVLVIVEIWLRRSRSVRLYARSGALRKTFELAMEKKAICLNVNGTRFDVTCESRKLLSDAIREDCRLTGTHVGCEHGVCGACTVLLDGRPTRSCLTYAVQAEGAQITTIEAVAKDNRLSPLQQALHECHGLQCGFCTPGIVMTFEAHLRDNPWPTEEQVRDVLSGNMCRCTGYQNIVRAILLAAERMGEDTSHV